jgi:hypothetical protein
MFRYEIVHGDDAEFIAYQRQLDDGIWQTLSRWMIPGTNSNRRQEANRRLTLFRYELVHGDDAEFIAYQRHLEDGIWQTLSRWMIPGTSYAPASAGPNWPSGRQTC